MPISTIGANGLGSGAVTSAKLASGQTLSVNGITFPAVQVPSADANTLDDYEEGTWTPSIQNMSLSAGALTGRYVKIGRQVTIIFELNNATLTGTPSLTVAALPFVNSSVRSTTSSVASHNTFGTGVENGVSGIILGNSATIDFIYNRTSTSWAGMDFRSSVANCYIHFSATYFID